MRSDCSRVQHLFSIYTTVKNNFSRLEGKIIVIDFNKTKIGGKVIAAKPFYSSHLLMVDLGIYDKDSLLGYLKSNDDIKSKLIAGNKIIASEYFDVVENTWSIKGIEGIFSKAYRVCKNPSSPK